MSEIFEIDLPEQFTIASVMSVSEKMFESFKSGAKEVSIKANNVVRADAAAVQLLCSFSKTAADEHMSYSFYQPSDGLNAAVKTLGMIDFLQTK